MPTAQHIFISSSTLCVFELMSQAWSRIVHSIIPNAAVLSRHLTTFAQACSATEAILFERTTFLVIATSCPPDEGSPEQVKSDLSSTRYERTSELIKALKHSCARMREEFHALEMELPEFTAVLDGMTKNTYILLIVHDPTIGMCVPRASSIATPGVSR